MKHKLKILIIIIVLVVGGMIQDSFPEVVETIMYYITYILCIGIPVFAVLMAIINPKPKGRTKE